MYRPQDYVVAVVTWSRLVKTEKTCVYSYTNIYIYIYLNRVGQAWVFRVYLEQVSSQVVKLHKYLGPVCKLLYNP